MDTKKTRVIQKLKHNPRVKEKHADRKNFCSTAGKVSD